MDGEIKKLKRTVKREPTSLQFALLADRYRTSGEIDNAIQVCQQGLSWHPTYATGYAILAQCYADQGLKAEAKEAWLDALRFAPDRLVVLKQLADLLKAGGDAAQALSYYRRAFAIDPFNAALHAEVSALSETQPPVVVETPQAAPPSSQYDAVTAAAWGTWIAGLLHGLLPHDLPSDGDVPDTTAVWPRPVFEALLALAEGPSAALDVPDQTEQPPSPAAPVSEAADWQPISEEASVSESVVALPHEPLLAPLSEQIEAPPSMLDEPVTSPPVIEEAAIASDLTIDALPSAAMDDSGIMRPEGEPPPYVFEQTEVLPPFLESRPGQEESSAADSSVPVEPAEPEVPERPAVPLQAAAPQPVPPSDHYLDQFFMGEEGGSALDADTPRRPEEAPITLDVESITRSVGPSSRPRPRDAGVEAARENELPSDVIPTATLAELYVRQGLIDRAVAVYMTLIEQDPMNPDLHNRLSALFVLKGRQSNPSAS